MIRSNGPNTSTRAPEPDNTLYDRTSVPLSAASTLSGAAEAVTYERRQARRLEPRIPFRRVL